MDEAEEFENMIAALSSCVLFEMVFDKTLGRLQTYQIKQELRRRLAEYDSMLYNLRFDAP